MQDSDETLALALDDIVDAFRWVIFVGFNESLCMLAGGYVARQKSDFTLTIALVLSSRTNES